MGSLASAATVLDIHTSWSWVVIATNAVAGLWALAAHFREEWRGRLLWGFTIVAQFTIVVQVVLGAVLLGTYDLEAPEFHAFYGFVMLITVGLVYSYRPQMKEQEHLLYGGGGLFLMGLGLRAVFLG